MKNRQIDWIDEADEEFFWREYENHSVVYLIENTGI
jgi:hypothetical protein